MTLSWPNFTSGSDRRGLCRAQKLSQRSAVGDHQFGLATKDAETAVLLEAAMLADIDRLERQVPGKRAMEPCCREQQ